MQPRTRRTRRAAAAHADEPRRLGVGARRRRRRGRRRAWRRPQATAANTTAARGARSATRPAVLPEPEPLEAAPAGPAPRRPRVAQRRPSRQRHHGRERDHDRRAARARRPARRSARPGAAPSAQRDRHAASRHRAAPAWPAGPRTTPQIANCEPIEMSIWRARITSVMPTAATSTGALSSERSRRLCGARRSAGAANGEQQQQRHEAAAREPRRSRRAPRHQRRASGAARAERQRQHASGVASARVEHATTCPPRMTAMRSLSAEHLRQLRRDQQDGQALRGQLARSARGSRPWRRRRRPAWARRGSGPRPRRQPARQRDLLLVAAGERRHRARRSDGVLTAQPLDEAARQRAPRARGRAGRARDSARSTASVALAATDISSTTPWRRRSSGT